MKPATVEITMTVDHAGRAAPPSDPAGRSPDGRWSAFIKDHNVWAKESAGGEEFALSNDGSEDDAYGDRFAWLPLAEARGSSAPARARTARSISSNRRLRRGPAQCRVSS